MAVLKWGFGSIPVGLFLLWGLSPRQQLFAIGAQVQSINRPRPAHSSSEGKKTTEDAEKPVSVQTEKRLAPFVPTPMVVVEKMLEIAQVTSRDVVFDLGSGDGRIVLRAAEKYGAKAVGVELAPHLVQESREKARELNLENLVTIIQGDFMKTSVRTASVVTIYLLPEANEKLRPVLEKDLRPGSRVVAHHVRIRGWQAAREEAVQIGSDTHFVYLYKIPQAFQGGKSPE